MTELLRGFTFACPCCGWTRQVVFDSYERCESTHRGMVLTAEFDMDDLDHSCPDQTWSI